MVRVELYDSRGELLRVFTNEGGADAVMDAVEWASPLSKIPGNKIGLVIYADDRPVDVMKFPA